jgi:two-component system, NarL family, response regulator NreC
MERIKVILVDDHQIVRDGIKSLITDNPNINIITEASSATELRDKLETYKPDVILMDINLPDATGIELTKELKESKPEIKVLILSMHMGEDFIVNAIEAGAKGYLPKTTSKKELITAINTIAKGEDYFNESISNILIKSYVKRAQTPKKEEEKIVDLTRREKEIITLFALGMSNKEIADKLFISIRTVESHKNNIMNKLELKSTVDLVKFALKNNYIALS